MNAPPDERLIDAFLARARRRIVVVRAVEGAVVGCAPALVAALMGVGPFIVAMFAVAGAIVRAALGDNWQWAWWRSRSALAQRVERRTPLGRNLIVTAAEAPPGVRHYVGAIVNARAAQVITGLDLSALFPLRRAVAVLMVWISLTSGLTS